MLLVKKMNPCYTVYEFFKKKKIYNFINKNCIRKFSQFWSFFLNIDVCLQIYFIFSYTYLKIKLYV